MIVCGGYARASKKGKEKSLLGSHEKTPEGLSGFEPKGLFADRIQFCGGSFLDVGRFPPGDLARVKLLSDMTESGAEIDETVAEGADGSLLLGEG